MRSHVEPERVDRRVLLKCGLGLAVDLTRYLRHNTRVGSSWGVPYLSIDHLSIYLCIYLSIYLSMCTHTHRFSVLCICVYVCLNALGVHAQKQAPWGGRMSAKAAPMRKFAPRDPQHYCITASSKVALGFRWLSFARHLRSGQGTLESIVVRLTTKQAPGRFFRSPYGCSASNNRGNP